MAAKVVMALLFLCSIAVAVSPSDRASAITYVLRSRSARIRKKAEALALDQEKQVLSAAEDQARVSQGGSSVLGVRSQKEFKTAVGSMLRDELAAAQTVKDMIEKSEDSAAAEQLRAASAQDPKRNLERFVDGRTASPQGQIIGLDRPSGDSSRDNAVHDGASCPGQESVSELSAAERLQVAQCVQQHQLELQRSQIAELEELGFGLQLQ